jgi:hypothetical protein
MHPVSLANKYKQINNSQNTTYEKISYLATCFDPLSCHLQVDVLNILGRIRILYTS